MIHCLSRTGLFLFALVLAPITFADGAVGAFTQTSGEVRILRGENYLAAEPGVEVESQDIIETDRDANAQLDMEDGSVMKLGPETRLALSEYKLDSNKSVLSAGIDLLSGWLRFAVSKLKPGGNYAINTPLLTIGIRGTEGTIDAQDDQGGLQLHEGEVEVAGVGEAKQALPPVRVHSGEYIQRQRGQDFRKLQQPSPEFLRRLPPGVQMKLARRVLDPRQRGISPRVIRGVTREDAQRMLQRYPRMNQRLQQRFNQVISPRLPTGGTVHERPVLVPPKRGGTHNIERSNAGPGIDRAKPHQNPPGEKRRKPERAQEHRKRQGAQHDGMGANPDQPQNNLPQNRQPKPRPRPRGIPN